MRQQPGGLRMRRGNLRNGAYLAALLALGLSTAVTWADRAIEPVNVGGTSTTTAPAAAVPTADAPARGSGPVSGGASDAPAASTPAAETPVVPAPVPEPVPPATPTETPAATAPAVTPPTATTATTEPTTAESQPAIDDKAYPITGFKVNYYKEIAKQPSLEKLLNLPVRLGVSRGGYTSPKEGEQVVTVKLGDIGKQGVTKIYASGIGTVYGSVVRFFNEQGIIGVFVVVDSKDIDQDERDIRPPERTDLQLVIVLHKINKVRTVLRKDVADVERVDLPEHKYVRDRSPLKSEDLLNKELLDNYILRLNRYQGRRVDAAISASTEPGEASLDYIVAQMRPWYVYAQVTNTGTKQTNPWRERFGATHTQLTGNDDTLILDYMTAGFDASHAVVGSYELPVFKMETLRYRIYASYNEFTASDVGQANQNFVGEEWSAGNELIWTVYQDRELFVDLVGGVKYQAVETDNLDTRVHGEGNFIVPYGSIRLSRTTNLAATSGSLTLLSYNTNASDEDVAGLGRSDPDTDPVILQFDLSQSAFLEPLLDPEGFAAGKGTLAHELFFSVRGQYGFGSRLFPQAQEVAGGFYSVRGYPEAVVAGDSVVIGTAEYRFHLPRALKVQPEPEKTPFLWDKRFRWSPAQTYGRPDWDLIGRAFIDVAQVCSNDKPSFERNYTLFGTGLGVELQYKQHFNVRVDWGVALNEVPDPDGAKAGSNRFHISATLLY
jgi:hemolysin activation/secretion protein